MPGLSRRAVLGGAAAAVATAGLWPRRARAAVSASDLKFVFVRVFGGWDPTRVFATVLDNPDIDTERDATVATAGGLSYVDHPDRPGIRTFFETWHARTLILNGVVIPSVNHRICERIAYTGSTVETASDVPTLLADAQADRYGLPHVQIGGTALPGTLARSLVRVGGNGEVGMILDGSILSLSDRPVAAPDATVTDLLDAFTREGARLRSARATGADEARLTAALDASLEKVGTMKALGSSVRWDTGGTFDGQIALGVDLLGLGISRCVTLAFESLTWDSHEANDEKQNGNFVNLFDGLTTLMRTLEETPGPSGGTLADETVVVVQSEMGRTPYQNGGKGKDHWQNTSALLVGPGLTGSRVVGGYTDLFYGETVDLLTGEIATGGRELTPAVVCSTLLAIGDVDGAESLREWAPILGILA